MYAFLGGARLAPYMLLSYPVRPQMAALEQRRPTTSFAVVDDMVIRTIRLPSGPCRPVYTLLDRKTTTLLMLSFHDANVSVGHERQPDTSPAKVSLSARLRTLIIGRA